MAPYDVSAPQIAPAATPLVDPFGRTVDYLRGGDVVRSHAGALMSFRSYMGPSILPIKRLQIFPLSGRHRQAVQPRRRAADGQQQAGQARAGATPWKRRLLAKRAMAAL